MNIEQAELYARIQSFRLDDAEAKLSFSQRLARENGWTRQYTQRVMAEYKKFAFLAVVAGHPVSPSKDVDEAWHLHLLYTHSYWGHFCPEVLQIPLHHEPTRGGGSERDKFDSWYTQTLFSYETWFGQVPPADIWPSPSKLVLQNKQRRRDSRWHWVFPQPRLNRRAIAVFAFLFTLAITSFTPSIASSVGTHIATTLSNPLDFAGAEFLGFYFKLLSVVTLFACGLRWYLCQPSHPTSVQEAQLDPYEMAYLASGKSRAVEAAIAHLVEHKHLKLLPKERAFELGVSLPTNNHFLEQAVIQAASKSGSIENIRYLAGLWTEAIDTHLQELGLLVKQGQAELAQWLPVLSISMVLLLGISKIFIGISQDKPVGLLIQLCLITVAIAWFLAQRPHRSRYGDSVLKQLQRQHIDLQSNSPATQLTLAVALFGTTVLVDTALADLQQVFVPLSSGSDGGDGGSGGGSGCGGGCGGCGGG